MTPNSIYQHWPSGPSPADPGCAGQSDRGVQEPRTQSGSIPSQMPVAGSRRYRPPGAGSAASRGQRSATPASAATPVAVRCCYAAPAAAVSAARRSYCWAAAAAELCCLALACRSTSGDRHPRACRLRPVSRSDRAAAGIRNRPETVPSSVVSQLGVQLC
jgi:hypothetical protein